MALLTAAGAFSRASADDFISSQLNTYGETGLLEMPSSRMAPDGQLWLAVGGIRGTQHVTLGFQILPWLQGDFRYSRIVPWGNKATDYDRSFSVKMRLFQETEYTPELSVGVRDLIGTGIYGAEYFAISKEIWNFDFTAGLGWGRLASNGTFHNLFGEFIPSFNKRTSPTGFGGKVDFGQFFHGPDTGVFGGATWHTPIENLNLIVEYSSDRYVREASFGGLQVKSPINAGLTYMPYPGISLTAGWFYGTTIGGALSVALDPTHTGAPVKINTPPMAPVLRSLDDSAHAVADLVEGIGSEDRYASMRTAQSPQISHVTSSKADNVEVNGQMLLVDVHAGGRSEKYCAKYAKAAVSSSGIDSVAVTDLDNVKGQVALCAVSGRNMQAGVMPAAYTSIDPPDDSDAINAIAAAERQIRSDAKAQGLRIEAVAINGSRATIYYQNNHYEFETEALGRLVRVLMADAPPEVEVFRLLPVKDGQPMQDVQILRAPLERMYNTRGTMIDVHQAVGLRSAPLENPILDSGERHTYPRFSWAISPAIRQGFFDPAAPYRAQLFASLKGGLEIAPGLSLESEYQLNLYNSFRGNGISNSVLPHVRSDITAYITKGATGFSTLDAAYHTRVAPDIFVEAKVGYLEDMFAGGGGQILWRPEGSRWAFGADIYEVWQRNFNRLFGLQHYHVLTGHVSVYYQSPWHGVNVNLHVGRYLAGDEGATVEVTRRFLTGIEIGAFATFTNVPFSRFGEGSFDKGIVIHIPLEWALPFSTQSSYDLELRPLTRDGGQRLDNDDSLYEETRRTSYEEISRNVEYVAHP